MKYLPCLILLSITHLLSAQQPLHTRYQRFDVESGLPQNLVSGIVQDDDGFIWVTTMDGLARFDGNDFLVFRHKPGDSTSLSSNTLNSLFKDNHNKLWVQGNDRSVNRIDPRTFQITSPAPVMVRPKAVCTFRNSFVGDRQNWFRLPGSTNDQQMKVDLYDTGNRKLQMFLSEETFGLKNVCAFSEDATGRLWVVTGEGMEVSDNKWKNFKSIPFPPALQFDPMTIDYSITVFHLKDQRVAIVGGGKIVLYNPQSGQFKSVSVENPPQRRLNLSSPVLDMQGRLVFEFQNHVYRLEADDHISLLWDYPARQGIRSILVDRTNTLWVGTDPDGLYKINLLAPEFESHYYTTNFVNDVLVNEVGVISSRLNAADINPYYSRSFISDDGNLLLYIYITNQGAVIAQLNGQSLDIILDNTGLGQIAKDKNGELRFLNSSGLLYTWRNIYEAPEILKIDLPSYPEGTSMISSIAADDTSLWVSSLGQGIHQFTNGKFNQTIDPTGSYPINIIRNDPDQSHVLWIGTISGGLYKWDKKESKLLATYTTENGLPSNTIYSLVPDALGYIWMSTNKGIVRLNRATEQFTNYTTADGLIEGEFNRHHYMQLTDGRIAMGGTKGYTVFDPLRFTEDTSTPEVFITHVAINDQWIDPINDRSFLKGPVNLQEIISLSHNENSIAFQVAAMQYNDSEKIKYRYMLEGYNRNWVVTGSDNEVRFNQLPGGRYTLLLNASNTLGVWSPEIRRLAIIVHPPFWLTWWAYSFYALAVVLVMRSFWRGYKRRLKARQEAEFNIREAARLREIDELKTRFFSNITHEFRTPLTLIMSPLEKHLDDQSLPPKAITLLNNNYRHAGQLLTLVNQLLDISKIEAGQMPVNRTAGELEPFARQIVESFQQLADKKQIALVTSFEIIQRHYLFDHEKWATIIVNLLSNALKFTPPKGSIRFLLREEKDPEKQVSRIVMKVGDTGMGIPSDKRHRIFERFYQVDDSATRTHDGTGIGLSLVKELVDLMEGTITVESEPRKGTLFTVQLEAETLREAPFAMDVRTINSFQPEKEQTIGIDHDLPLLLVVEDNDELRAFIKESLSATWNVLEASNGSDGWILIERELPEVVICDVMMPGLNGIELCARSKSDFRTAHIGFIMLTAKAAHESRIQGLEAGADEYVTKPFHLYELELRIRNLLQEQHSLRKHLQERLLSPIPSPELPHVNDLFLSKLHAYLEEHISDSKLNIESVANAMAMSKSTLNRKLKALLNSPVSEYIRKYRLNKATALLAAGLTVSEVSFRVGFETSSYFSQCFKDHFKKTPTEFVRIHH